MAQIRLGLAYRLLATVLRPLLSALARRDWRGAQHLPRAGGVVVVTNHLSYLDPLTVAHFLYDHGRPPRYLAKSRLFRLPVLGRIITGCAQIPVYRESRDAALAFRAAIDAVQRGECVTIYPEGTITRDPGLWPMTGKTGAARVALSTGCDVVPVGQWGAQQVLAPYALRPRPWPRATVHVYAGAPVGLGDLRGRDATPDVLRQATERIMDALTAQVALIRGEQPPPIRYDPRGVPPTAVAEPAVPDQGEERAQDPDPYAVARAAGPEGPR